MIVFSENYAEHRAYCEGLFEKIRKIREDLSELENVLFHAGMHLEKLRGKK